jgi:hypothetical protein
MWSMIEMKEEDITIYGNIVSQQLCKDLIPTWEPCIMGWMYE